MKIVFVNSDRVLRHVPVNGVARMRLMLTLVTSYTERTHACGIGTRKGSDDGCLSRSGTTRTTIALRSRWRGRMTRRRRHSDQSHTTCAASTRTGRDTQAPVSLPRAPSSCGAQAPAHPHKSQPSRSFCAGLRMRQDADFTFIRDLLTEPSGIRAHTQGLSAPCRPIGSRFF